MTHPVYGIGILVYKVTDEKPR